MIQGVQLLHVEIDGPDVTADVFGGDEPGVMAEIVFRIDDPIEHQHLVRTFEAWERQARRLTLVEGKDGVITLVDEDGALYSALG